MLCSKPPVRKFRPPKDKEKRPASDDNVDDDVLEKTDPGSVDKTDDNIKNKPDVKSDKPFTEGDEESAEERLDHKIDSLLQGGSSIIPVKSRSKRRVSKKDSGDAASSESLRAEVKDIPSGSESTSEGQFIEGSKLLSEKEDLLQEAAQDKSPEVLQDEHHQYNLHKAKLFMIALLVTNLVPALYFSLIHQRGTVMVTKFVYDTTLNKPDTGVLFLMPCHSTPYYSYIHRNISMRFLTCEPNLKGVANYTDEAELFYQDPQEWLRKEYLQSKQSLPSIVVYFDTLQKDISSILIQGGYHPCESFFHTHVPDGRVGSYVLVSCR